MVTLRGDIGSPLKAFVVRLGQRYSLRLPWEPCLNTDRISQRADDVLLRGLVGGREQIGQSAAVRVCVWGALACDL